MSCAPFTRTTDKSHLSSAPRLEAVVDWAELIIHLSGRTNGWTLNEWASQNLGISAYFDPQDEGLGRAASTFIFRIQDPANWDSVANALCRIEEAYPFSLPPTLTSMEIALDAYIEGASRDELATHVFHRYRHMRHPTSLNQRFSGRYKGDKEEVTVRDSHRLLREGRNIVIGEFGHKHKSKPADPITMRLYVKTKDQNNKVELIPSQWRSRWEITLRRDAMPFSTIEDARGFKFESLSEHFYTCIDQKENQSVLDKIIWAAKRQLGAKRDKPVMRRRKYPSGTIADAAENDAAYQALKKLTRSMNPKPRGGYRAASTDVAHNPDAEIPTV